jgi:NAD+ synthase (glutamine-hydrolysing)
MRPVSIGLANINTTVGALKSNTDKIIERASLMAKERCTVGCFTEQVISGYPVEDLVGWKGFVDAQWNELLRFADATQNFEHPVVFVVGLTVRDHEDNYNCAAVVQKGVVLGIVPKEKLPGYDVFYETRMFTSGTPGIRGEIHGVPFGDLIFRFPFGCMSVEICEDGWFADGPQRRRAFSGAELAVNLSASPYRSGIVDLRRSNITARSRENRTAFAYVNQFGAQDSLVFDGGGFVYQSGDPVFEAARWREQISYCTIDLNETEQARHRDAVWLLEREAWLKENIPVPVIDASLGDASFVNPHPLTPPSFPPPQRSQAELFNELLTAMKLGLKDYFEKTGAFKTIGIAMSGGKDSALTLIVAWLYARERFADLNEKDRAVAIHSFIHCFSMPTRYNSRETRLVAHDL